MDSFLYSINATVPIFLVMIIGWGIKQLGVIDDHFANVANKYVFKVALPVLLFRDLAVADFKSQFDAKFVLYCMIVTTRVFSGIWICTEIFMKDDTQKGAFVQASFRSSAAILGMAFIQNMYQSTGMAPLMIVAGDHAINDMASDEEDSWKSILENKGYNVECIIKGLGEYKEIRNIFIEHIQMTF